MTDDELNAIEARANAATEGPWGWGNREREWGCDAYSSLNSGRKNVIYGCGTHTEGVVVVPSDADRDFLAASRSDVPALIAEIRRLRLLIPCPMCKGGKWVLDYENAADVPGFGPLPGRKRCPMCNPQEKS